MQNSHIHHYPFITPVINFSPSLSIYVYRSPLNFSSSSLAKTDHVVRSRADTIWLSSRVVEEGDVTEEDEGDEDGIRFVTLESPFENKEVVPSM